MGPPPTWMDLPAEDLDWALAIDDAVAEARKNLQEEDRG